MKVKKLLTIAVVVLIALVVLSRIGNSKKEKEKVITEECPNYPPKVERIADATRKVWDKLKKSEKFSPGQEVDLGYFKVKANFSVKKEYKWQDYLVKAKCPNLIVEFEIEKTSLAKSKERTNPLFLTAVKEYPPQVGFFAIFEKYFYIRGCEIVEGRMGFDKEASIGSKVKGVCKISFRPDWGKERYLVLELFQPIKGGSALIPVLPINKKKVLKYYKSEF